MVQATTEAEKTSPEIAQEYSRHELPPIRGLDDCYTVERDGTMIDIEPGDVIARQFNTRVSWLAVLQICPDELICWSLNKAAYQVYPRFFVDEDMVEHDLSVIDDPWDIRESEEPESVIVVSDTGRKLHWFSDAQGVWREETGDDHLTHVLCEDGEEVSIFNGNVVFAGSLSALPDPHELEEEHQSIDGRNRWGCCP